MIDPNTAQRIEILAKHQVAWGSGFLMHRDGTPAYPGMQTDFTPAPSFVRFLRLLPRNLLSAGAAASGSKEWETFAVAFYQDGCGNAYFFDTRHRRPDGEYAILLWSHDDANQDSTHMQTVALDFPEWLAKCACAPRARQAKATRKKGCLATALGLAVLTLLLLASAHALAAGDPPAAMATNNASTNGISSNVLWRLWIDSPTNATGPSALGFLDAGATNRWSMPGTAGLLATSSPWRVTTGVEMGFFHAGRGCGRRSEDGWYQGVDVGMERDVIPGEVSIGLGVSVGRISTRGQ